MKKSLLTLLTLAVLLLVGCANNPAKSGEGTGGGKDTTPTVREQDALLIRAWNTRDKNLSLTDHHIDMESKVYQEDPYMIIIINGATATERYENYTRSDDWYTDKGVLYINNMHGRLVNNGKGFDTLPAQFTGDLALAYTVSDTSYMAGGAIIRKDLRLTPVTRTEEFAWIAELTYMWIYGR